MFGSLAFALFSLSTFFGTGYGHAENTPSQLRRQLTFKGKIVMLQLYDATKDMKVIDLTNGTVVNIEDVHGMTNPSFNINADFIENVRSVVYSYNNAKYRVEEKAPFAFCANNRTDFFKCSKLGCGNHTVSAVPYSRGGGNGDAGLAYTVSFAIVCPSPVAPMAPPVMRPVAAPVLPPVAPKAMDPVAPKAMDPVAPKAMAPVVVAPVTGPAAPKAVTPVAAPVSAPVTAPVTPPVMAPPTSIPLKITGFGLINVDKDTKIMDLVNGTIVNVKNIPDMATPSFNINATYTGAVRSVVYLYDNSKYTIEEAAPYAFCNNKRADFFKCRKLVCGNHTVTAIPYPRGSGQGDAGTAFTVSFAITC